MTDAKEAFKKTALLTTARLVGMTFSFAIPMYLGRALSVETYGTYKQVMILFWFSQVALNLWFDDSAYYYLRRDRHRFSLYSFNALMFNVIVTGVLWLAVIYFKVELARLLNNPSLANYLPWVGYLIFVTVCSMQSEGILMGLDRFRQRLALEMGMELLKSKLLVWTWRT